MKHLSFGRTSAKPKAMIEREEEKEEKIVILNDVINTHPSTWKNSVRCSQSHLERCCLAIGRSRTGHSKSADISQSLTCVFYALTIFIF